MLKHKSFMLNRYSYDNQVISHTNSWWEYMMRFAIGLHFVMDDGNEVTTFDSGYGDRCISNDSFLFDGDLVLSVGWGDGFGIRKVNNDGTMTYLWGESKPNNGYVYYQSIALDTVRHHAYVGNHAYNNIAKYDYSDIVLNGGNTVTKTVLTKANGDVPADEVGYDFENGLVVISDYLYTLPDDFFTDKVLRMKLSDGNFDHISVIGIRNTGEHGSFWYDSTNNRLYIWWMYNGEYWVVLNPDKATTDSTNPAKAYRINLVSYTGTDDIYSGGVSIDPNNPNHVWFHSYYGRFIKLDITNVLNGSSSNPTVLYQNPIVKYTSSYKVTMPNGRHVIIDHPIYGGEMPIISPDRGWWRNFGWFDVEHGLPVGMSYTGWSHFDGYNKHRYTMYSNNLLTYDYGGIPKVVTTADGSQYLVYSGYGSDGYKFRTWTIDKFQLYTSGDIVWGDFKFDDDADIRYVHLERFNNDTIYVPTNTTFTIEVSNDGGTTWEMYDYSNADELHEFNSVGNTVRVKVTMTGNGKKHSYMLTQDFPEVHIYGGEFYNNYRPNSTQSFKISGI